MPQKSKLKMLIVNLYVPEFDKNVFHYNCAFLPINHLMNNT